MGGKRSAVEGGRRVWSERNLRALLGHVEHASASCPLWPFLQRKGGKRAPTRRQDTDVHQSEADLR